MHRDPNHNTCSHQHDDHHHEAESHSHDESDQHDPRHGHGHGHHGHNHAHHAPDKINTAFIIAILANFGFTVIQAIYAYLANSTSLLADAGHNLGDVLGLIFSWIASMLLKKKASTNLSYGFKKTSILAALINALILIFACVVIALTAVDHLLHQGQVAAVDVMVVAGIGILVNGGTALLFMKGQEDLNVKSAFMHLAYDALISFGVVVAAALIYFTGWHIIDPIVGLIITVTIFWGTWGLLRDSVKLAVDAVPLGIDLTAVRDYFNTLPGVEEVHDLHIWGMSTRENALTVHLFMPDEQLSDSTRQEINVTLQKKFNIHHTTIQIEREANCVHTHSC